MQKFLLFSSQLLFCHLGAKSLTASQLTGVFSSLLFSGPSLPPRPGGLVKHVVALQVSKALLAKQYCCRSVGWLKLLCVRSAWNAAIHFVLSCLLVLRSSRTSALWQASFADPR